jgi:hypothetical protein
VCYSRNLEASYKAAAFYNEKIAPALKNFCDVARSNEDRLARTKSRCASVLELLALGWEWSSQFVNSEQTLDRALELARSTPVESTILKALDRVRPLAGRERASDRLKFQWTSSPQLPDKPAPIPKKPRPAPPPKRELTLQWTRSSLGRGGIRAAVVAIGLFIVIVRNVMTPPSHYVRQNRPNGTRTIQPADPSLDADPNSMTPVDLNADGDITATTQP